ncbi:hypothetical protein [Emticicia agri]|uniref:Uncharacterized protein n=1 Tax=Emticicia agri TaxID=2492393 RepID=A0A4Q5LW43_9BACT|nr:hypothetical protein [Emticicia agri]RYU93971.1 hypothetical protein EWM59_19620 [Emticicia agri]
MESFWPKIDTNNFDSPFNLIKIQGDLLEQNTNGVLTYFIDKKTINHSHWPTGSALRFEFFLRAPLFEDFKFMLFYLVHDLVAIYPVLIGSFTNEKSIKCNNFEELQRNLKEILNKSETAAVLNSLMMQSK